MLRRYKFLKLFLKIVLVNAYFTYENHCLYKKQKKKNGKEQFYSQIYLLVMLCDISQIWISLSLMDQLDFKDPKYKQIRRDTFQLAPVDFFYARGIWRYITIENELILKQEFRTIGYNVYILKSLVPPPQKKKNCSADIN